MPVSSRDPVELSRMLGLNPGAARITDIESTFQAGSVDDGRGRIAAYAESPLKAVDCCRTLSSGTPRRDSRSMMSLPHLTFRMHRTLFNTLPYFACLSLKTSKPEDIPSCRNEVWTVPPVFSLSAPRTGSPCRVPRAFPLPGRLLVQVCPKLLSFQMDLVNLLSSC